MPHATASWLVDNTSLTFQQIALFCGLHRIHHCLHSPQHLYADRADLLNPWAVHNEIRVDASRAQAVKEFLVREMGVAETRLDEDL